MYTMDQTTHFEHRIDDRRDESTSRRWSRRGRATTSPSTASSAPLPSDADAEPTHEVLD